MISAGLVGLMVLSACEEQEPILQGERFGTREVLEAGDPDAGTRVNSARPAAVPAAVANADWAQSPVSPFTRVGNAAFSRAPQLAFAVNIGTGDGRRRRLNVDPVVGGGRVYVMDAAHVVSAVSPTGQVLWRKEMTPIRDTAEQAQGGGLAFDAGRLYVTSGFGRIAALDAATGAEIWVQRLGNTATGAPTVAGGLVYLTSGDERGWALEADTGRIRWDSTGLGDVNNVAGAPAPAVSDDLVIFAYGTGGVQALFREGGLRRWSADVVGTRQGSALASITDITGGPVIFGDKVFVGNHSGRVVGFHLGSGERIWTARMGALGPVWPTADSVYLISDLNRLVRLDAGTGEQIWSVDLPGYENVRKPQKRRDSAYAHYGPVIAGGRLVVPSSDGLLRSFDPVNGALLSAVAIPGGATTAPAIAGGTLFVLGKSGQLLGYR
ncbi:quinoprotein [Salipiger aestuarii]|uniref:Outer membrane protein assembly factor BamB n=2 Tax=Salipiger aestuarii TaxID=568098 RepID=A0A327YKC4_9RHOB|nr:quinoprotein [Salipiger aestuarii]KAA8615212.1 quinoprotein [Salipiger aestuarii]KAB2542862.1 quinoprotein [Salipiger aestuarii]RAK20777.1 outer membrane protein assembly factor BamB [Salipiger aestuarii]